MNPITDPNDLHDDEYLVVLKTSNIPSNTTGKGDYHFVMRLSDGSWADKQGGGISR